MERRGPQGVSKGGKIRSQNAENSMEIGVRVDLETPGRVECAIGPDQRLETRERSLSLSASGNRVLLGQRRGYTFRRADPIGKGLLRIT